MINILKVLSKDRVDTAEKLVKDYTTKNYGEEYKAKYIESKNGLHYHVIVLQNADSQDYSGGTGIPIILVSDGVKVKEFYNDDYKHIDITTF